MKYDEEVKKLKMTHWPMCEAVAMALAAHGPSAGSALVAAASSRIHQVRSASLKALATIDRDLARDLALKLRTDRAYEVRETAEAVIRDLDGGSNA